MLRAVSSVATLCLPLLMNLSVSGAIDASSVSKSVETEYEVTEVKDGLAIAVLRNGVSEESSGLQLEISPQVKSRAPVLELSLLCKDGDAIIDLTIRGGRKGEANFRKVVKARAHAQVLEFGCDAALASIADRVDLKIESIEKEADPTTEVDRPEYVVHYLRFSGESVIEQSISELATALEKGKILASRAEVGSGEGQFKPNAIKNYSKVLDRTEARLDRLHRRKDFAQISDAIAKVYDQMTLFESRAQSSISTELIDQGATCETRYLYSNLKEISGKRLIYGMQDATGYGVGWRNDNDRSDVKDVCGDFPGVFGWDAMNITMGGGADTLKSQIESAYRMGGINTISWHAYDPLGHTFYAEEIPDTAYDGSIVASLLPDGMYHDEYVSRLRKVGSFMKHLRGPDGESIPIIFRPFHEHNGFWFWWGKDYCSPEDFVSLWRFTVEYLRDEMELRNLIYVFSPDTSMYGEAEEFFDIYPGDEYVDVFGIDGYWMKTPEEDKPYLVDKLKGLVANARGRGKLAVLSETGDKFDYENGGERLANHEWFTKGLLASVLTDESTRGIAFAMTWRNDNPNHHFNPYPDHPSVPDFLDFYKHPYTAFLQDIPGIYDKPE